MYIKKVETKKEAKLFTEFPNILFKSHPAYVPALTLDELHVFDPAKNPVHSYCESVRFLAYDGKKIVGRIAGIINHQYNKEFQTKVVRFSRIDMIDDIEVTKLLIEAVTNWGKEKGMVKIIGPIGFTDMDRMGLLIEGFDYLNMFITIWNPPYYYKHLEKLGFIKDATWVESRIPWPSKVPDRIIKGSQKIRNRFGYKLVKINKMKELDKYIYDAFDVYNRAFNELYGFFPVTKKVMDYYIKQVKSIARLNFVWFVLDKDDKVIAFGLMMPSLGLANKKNNGKLFPFGFLRILKSLRKFNVIDLYFIAVDPKDQGRGVFTLILEDGIKEGIKHNVLYAETGPELIDNYKILNQWKDFNPSYHRMRSCYIKKIGEFK